MKKLLVFGLMIFCAGSLGAEELPVEYFGLPMIKSPIVSPDGKHIAAQVLNQSGNYDVVVTEFGGTDLTTVARLEDALDRIEYISWANNERLLISASYSEQIAGNYFRPGRLFSVNLDGTDTVQLSRARDKDNKQSRYYSGDQVISMLKDDPRHILLQMYDPLDEAPAVYKVDVYTGDFEKLFVNDYDVVQWVTNHKGQVIIGIARETDEDRVVDEKDLTRTFWYRDNPESEWKKLKSVVIGQEEKFSPAAVSTNKQYMYVMSDHAIGRVGLYKYNVSTGEYEDLVYAVEGYDLLDIIEEDGRLVGVRWAEDYVKQHYFDPADAKLYELVKKTFKGAEVGIASSDRSDKKLVIYAIRDNTPGKFYLLDLEKGKASFWFSQYPYLEGKPLAAKMPFDYTGKDGMKLHGYLTLPVDVAGEKPPLVVMPHGGPQARDYRYFDPLAQLLASRGYAVLQMNFRGSTGFGSKYEAAGYKEWGQTMQQDVLAAVDWAEKSGRVDTSRMCMVGASYGGYVALTASVQTPKKFDCIVSIAGISDLVALVKDFGWFSNSEGLMSEIIGDVNKDKEHKMLVANSAINQVEKVSTPMLLIHGTRDTQVRLDQSENFYDKARRLDKNVEYLEIENGTHYLDFQPNRIEAFAAVDEFLKEYLK